MVDFNSILGGVTGGATIAIVITAVDKYSAEFKKAETSMDKFRVSAELVATAAITALVAFSASAVQAAMKMLPIEKSFARLAENSGEFVKELRYATSETVNDFELMSNANKALLLGLDQEALPNLFKNAAIVGRAAGRTTTEAISDITLGIGRQSRLILDNLGIIIRAENVYEDYAQSIGKATDSLTAQEKQTAFTQAAMDALNDKAQELGGTLEEDVLTRTQRLSAAFENMKIQFGQELLPMLGQFGDFVSTNLMPTISGFFKLLGKGFEGMTVGFLAFGDLINVLAIGVDQFILSFLSGIQNIVNGVVDAINFLIRGINKIGGALGFKKIAELGKVTIDTSAIERAIADLEKKRLDTAKKIQDITFGGMNATTGVTTPASKEQTLAEQLSRFMLIPSTGDIFNPRQINVAGTTGEFKTQEAKRLAEAFMEGRYNPALDQGGARIVTINIENVNGLDPEEVARALERTFGNKVSI